MMDRHTRMLRRLTPGILDRRRTPVADEATLIQAAKIVKAVRERGEQALKEYALRLDGLGDGKLYYGKEDFNGALENLPEESRALLERTASRIAAFARAQIACLGTLRVPIPGGYAGHEVFPVAAAGCYAPGGRYPLPSSVLMTALTAKIAGVESVWVASPHPARETLAACALAGADGLLAAGGAHAIAALAYGAGPVPAANRVVGPGNRWVAAAKRLVSGDTVIESVAGPSELFVLADDHSDPDIVAADLLAQAEHDPDAIPVLGALSEDFVVKVEEALERRLATLPTADVARKALSHGGALIDSSVDALAKAADAFAPEHLEILTPDPAAVSRRIKNAGAVFLGAGAAEVLGDYGVGPNHVLPTGGSARSTGGLSALSFLRVRTWIRIENGDRAKEIYRDAANFARIEGLEAHARAAECR